MRKLTTKEFIDRANKVHDNKYDYSRVNYINNNIKIIIICKKHNKFLQKPSAHCGGSGCPQCSKKKKLTTKEFIKKANKVHNNKYDYSKTNYINTKTNVIIICKKHNEFLQTPYCHLHSAGCKKCYKENQFITTQQFINRASKIHKNKYNYSKIDYKHCKTKIIIICPKHGQFLQKPCLHLDGSGCKECQIEKTKFTKEIFIEKANKVHNNKYDYSKINYVNIDTKIIIVCKKHSEFLQSPYCHLKGANCPSCSHTISKGETRWLNKIEKENNIKIERNPTIYINGQRFKPDGFHKPTNAWYEYNGYFIHGHPDHYEPNDINKMLKKTFRELYQATLDKEKIIKSAGYNLITKWGN